MRWFTWIRDRLGNIHESLAIAMLMALVGGYLDIYTYLARGKVFANTQTGNLVLLGCNLAEGNGNKVIYYLLSILSFMGGIGLAELIEHRWNTKQGFRWLHVTLAMEMICLFIVMFLPAGEMNIVANMIVSFVCALQVQTFRKVKGVSYSTTMFTGNLKNAAERLSNYAITKEERALDSGVVYVAIILMFITGAYVGDLLTNRFYERAVGFANIILGFVFILLYMDSEKEKQIKG